MDRADVVIVGAGPTGLLLAGELGLAGVRATVLERETAPTELPRANGLVGHVVRVLEARGVLDGVPDLRPFSPPRFPFGPLSLELNTLPVNPLRVLPIPQPRLEALLTRRAEQLGTTVRRGHAVIDLHNGDEAATLTVTSTAGEYRMTADYVIGCDGAHSFVRKAAGIDFPGVTSDETSRIGRARLRPAAVDIDNDVIGIRNGPQLNLFRPNRTPTGAITIAPVAALDPSAGRDVFLISTKETRRPQDRDLDLTAEEFDASIHRVLGSPLPIEHLEWVRATVANSRQASRYRNGRVLLAGDAAHVFAAGGSALNVGLQDAVNLGWKLAAQIQGWGSEQLLDSYQDERHPVGAAALAQTRAQAALSSPDATAGALRELLTELLRYPEPLRYLADALEGSPAGWAPDVETAEPISRSMDRALRRGRALLIDGSEDHAFGSLAEPWSERLDLVDAPSGSISHAPIGMLVRPDGCLAWAAGDTGRNSVSALDAALNRWLGRARRPTP